MPTFPAVGIPEPRSLSEHLREVTGALASAHTEGEIFSGAGLTAVWRLILEQGGQVSGRGVVGGGATVMFTLPRDRQVGFSPTGTSPTGTL